jgi:hypothetical protein
MPRRRREAAGYGLPLNYARISLRDGFTVQPVRGQQRAFKYAAKRGKPKSPVTAQQNSLFKNLAAAQKDMWDVEQVGARGFAYNSGYVWRDVLARALVGRLIVWGPDLSDDIQTQLDTITSTIGAILLRTAAGWVGLDAGAADQLMTVDPATGLPSWQNPPAVGGVGMPQVLAVPSWSSTANSNTNFMHMTAILAKANQLVTGVNILASAASATSKVYASMYDVSGHAPHNRVAVSLQVTGLAAGQNLIPFVTPYLIPADGVYWLGISTSVAAFNGPANISSMCAFVSSTGAPPNPAPTVSYASGGNIVLGLVY